MRPAYSLFTVARISPTVAYNCLKSVPLKSSQALDLIERIKAYAQFQSTLPFLKRPPPGYLLPPVDVLEGIDDIIARTKSGRYRGEYDYQYDLYKLTLAARDGHFIFIGDLVAGIFEFTRPFYLISYSEDGIESPKIYVLGNYLRSILLPLKHFE